MIDAQLWIKNFNQQLPPIKIAFDALFAKGKLEDYFEIKLDGQTGLPAIYIFEGKDLPKQIEQELSGAFNKAKPAETSI